MESAGSTKGTVETPPGIGLQEKLLGGLAIVLILIAVYLLVTGALGREEVAPVPTAPAVTILGPESGSTIGRQIDLRFSTEETLTSQPSGWGVGGLHLHADVGGVEVMPAPSDIRPLQDGSYGWTIQAPDTGSIAVRLFWSDEGHVPIPLSATDDIFLTVR
jgi:hypothetical protein